MIDNWQHQWDGTNWGGERGTGKYSPPSNPDGVVITVGGNIGHGAVGSQGVSLAIIGEGAGTYWNTGGGFGFEGINAGIGVSLLWKNSLAEKRYGTNLPLQDISGTGMQYGGSFEAGIAFGGSYSYNTTSDNLLRPATYNAIGANVGIGTAGLSIPFGGSAQVTVSQPLLMVDKNGFYLGKGRN